MVPIGHNACFPYYLYLEQLCVVDMFLLFWSVTAGRLGLVRSSCVGMQVCGWKNTPSTRSHFYQTRNLTRLTGFNAMPTTFENMFHCHFKGEDEKLFVCQTLQITILDIYIMLHT